MPRSASRPTPSRPLIPSPASPAAYRALQSASPSSRPARSGQPGPARPPCGEGLRPLAVALAVVLTAALTAALTASGTLGLERDAAAAKSRSRRAVRSAAAAAPTAAPLAGSGSASANAAAGASGGATAVAAGGAAGGAPGHAAGTPRVDSAGAQAASDRAPAGAAAAGHAPANAPAWAPAAAPRGAAAAAPGAAPAQSAGSAVFFMVEGNPARGPLTLVPLQCYDAARKARLAGEACLPLLPAGATVQTAGGPLQLGEAAAPQCPRQPAVGGVRLRGKAQAVPLLYGAWPSLTAVRYAAAPEKSLGGAMAPVEKLMRKAIAAATSLLVADLAIYQIIALPLRGERSLQKVYSVAVPDRRGRTRFSGLLIGDVDGKQAAVAGADELPGVKQHSMQIVGSMDIDHDGMLELLVNSGGQNLDRYSVRAYDGEKLEVVSYWHSCGD